jgi:hypothetical protein
LAALNHARHSTPQAASGNLRPCAYRVRVRKNAGNFSNPPQVTMPISMTKNISRTAFAVSTLAKAHVYWSNAWIVPQRKIVLYHFALYLQRHQREVT